MRAATSRISSFSPHHSWINSRPGALAAAGRASAARTLRPDASLSSMSLVLVAKVSSTRRVNESRRRDDAVLRQPVYLCVGVAAIAQHAAGIRAYRLAPRPADFTGRAVEMR